MTRLRLLLIEDSEDDAALVLRELQQGGFDVSFKRVETRDALIARLDGRETWDIIVSDYSLPSFSAPEALAVVRGLGLDLSFIIVSGTIGEETAVEAMRAGAQDFIVKGSLARLVPAVERELREVKKPRRMPASRPSGLSSSARCASAGSPSRASSA